MFVRTWQWDITRIGVTYGIVNLIAGPVGVNLGGWIADRMYRAGRPDGHMRACYLFGAYLFVPVSVVAPLMPTAELAVAMLVPAGIGAAAVTANGSAALMMVTPNQVRAQATALYYFVISIIGLSVGGAGVGAITDYAFGDGAALRYTLAVVSAGAGVLGIVFMRVNLRHYGRAMAESDAWSD
jgi:MFS family permease